VDSLWTCGARVELRRVCSEHDVFHSYTPQGRACEPS
jgi:hypothetical protein